MEATFDHEIVFGTRGYISVSDVAKSLLANEEILRVVGSVMEKCIEGLVVEKIDIKFKSSTTNSPLKEIFLVTIFTTWQSDLNKKVPEMLEQLTGAYIPEKYDAIVTIIMIAIVIYGIDFAYKKIAGKTDNEDGDEGSISITGNRNVVLKIAGDTLGTTPEKVASAIDAAIKPPLRDTIARKALDFIRPAKREAGAEISGSGATITADAIADAPSALDIEMAGDDESHNPYQRQTVVIHATDLDKTKTGWAGHLPGLWEKRLKMQLYPGVSPKAVFAKSEIVADIILASKPNKDGEIVPYLFHVVKVYD